MTPEELDNYLHEYYNEGPRKIMRMGTYFRWWKNKDFRSSFYHIGYRDADNTVAYFRYRVGERTLDGSCTESTYFSGFAEAEEWVNEYLHYRHLSVLDPYILHI